MFSVLKSKPGKGIQIVMGVLLVAGLLLLARKLADITTQEADAGVSSISGQEVSFNRRDGPFTRHQHSPEQLYCRVN